MPDMDLWSPISFKELFRREAGEGRAGNPETGVPRRLGWAKHHYRRLAAYNVLRAYVRNAARYWSSGSVDTQRREMGDAALVASQYAAAVIGSTQDLIVKGSGDDSNTTAQQLQEWLEDWAEKELLISKLVLMENQHCVPLGDGVIELGFDYEKNRCRMQVHDPGAYFPEIEPNGDFPRRVHIAFSYIEGTGVDRSERIQVTSYELVRQEQPVAYPWGTSSDRCFKWSRVYSALGINESAQIEDMGSAGIVNGTNTGWVDQGIDYIPVVHVPNSLTDEHFGESSLSSVLQIFDDLSGNDTDTAKTAKTTGWPILALAGGKLGLKPGEKAQYGPGDIFELGESGRMSVLDTSSGLDALLKLNDSLQGRLSTNGRIPEAMLGRVDPGQVPSGLAFSLAFAPMSTAINNMRLVRKEKYPLLLKLIHRMTQAGYLSAGLPLLPEWPGGEIRLGSWLPTDKKSEVDIILSLRDRDLVSLPTALTMLRAVGVDIPVVTAEVELIRGEDLDGAQQVSELFGVERAADYLGVDPPDQSQLPPPPAVDPPGTPPATGA